MDADVRDALADLKFTVRESAASTNRRIDDLVTRGEFNAVVQRIDGQHNALQRAFELHEESTEQVIIDLRAADTKMLNEAKAETLSLRDAILKQLSEFRLTTRWAIGLTATGVGLLAGIFQWVLSVI